MGENFDAKAAKGWRVGAGLRFERGSWVGGMVGGDGSEWAAAVTERGIIPWPGLVRWPWPCISPLADATSRENLREARRRGARGTELL